MRKLYLGLPRRDIFRSATTPTEQSHGKAHKAVIGPFRTMRGAIFMRDFGSNNPHCQTVAAAERLAVKYA
jgi:hypothetical protein